MHAPQVGSRPPHSPPVHSSLPASKRVSSSLSTLPVSGLPGFASPLTSQEALPCSPPRRLSACVISLSLCLPRGMGPYPHLCSLPTHFPVSCSENRSTHRYFYAFVRGEIHIQVLLCDLDWCLAFPRQRDEYLKYMHTYLEVDGEFFLDWKSWFCVDTNLFQFWSSVKKVAWQSMAAYPPGINWKWRGTTEKVSSVGVWSRVLTLVSPMTLSTFFDTLSLISSTVQWKPWYS